MKKLSSIFAALLVSAVAVLTLSAGLSASAYNPITDVCNNAAPGASSEFKPSDSSTCQDSAASDGKGNPATGPDGIILRVSTIIAVVASIVAVVMIIMAGAKMITAGGDANEVKQARDKLLHSVVGLVIIVLAQSIVALIVTQVL